VLQAVNSRTAIPTSQAPNSVEDKIMSETSKNWFEIDRKGLAKLIERRGKGALVQELIANALDAEGTTRVEIILEPEEGVPHATVIVRDDSPKGFTDISHAWTVFAESERKSYPTKHGRFDLGEKLVLALCNEASIISTKAAVMFDSRGRTSLRARRNRGTEFQGIARITRAELTEIQTDLSKIIPPSGVTILVNGKTLSSRLPLKTIEAKLLTEVADNEGYLKRSSRKTTIEIYKCLPGETAMLYEMGIPIVETGDKFHVSVAQKVPLSMERDNVTPAYLRDVRTHVVNAMHAHLDEADANAPLVNEALADEQATPEAIKHLLDLRYGERRAIFDPSDPEANMALIAAGYTLIKGGQLTGPQWANAKKHDPELRPSGQIRPTKKALFSPDGKDSWVPREKWTPAMRAVTAYSAEICCELVGSRIEVSILSDITQNWAACYGSQGLVFNLGRLGHAFFDACLLNGTLAPTVTLNQLLIHELGHNVESNHLDERYHDAICALGVKLTQLALSKPELFRQSALL
jgi:hypothetical protein